MTDSRKVAEAFAQLLSSARPRLPGYGHYVSDEARRRAELNMSELLVMPVGELKSLWDRYSGDPDCEPDGYSGEEIHDALNRRGYGHYCAV